MTLAEGTTGNGRAAAQAMPPTDIDILDPRFYDDPWDQYRWLRTNAPLWWDARNEMWVVSRHEDVSHISRNQDLYSAAQGVRPKVPSPMSIISMDDPEHTRQRRLVNKGFTPRMVRQLSDHIRELSNQIIDDIAERGECDFVEDFAIHVPLIVIAELMGLDPATREKLYRWSDAMMAGDGHVDPDDPVLLAAAEAGGAFATVCIDLIEQRRADGSTDDLIGILTHAFDEGALAQAGDGAYAGTPGEAPDGGLSHDELLMFLILLVVAGNETTRNALSGGLVAFSRFPDQHAKLLAQPELIDLAVDEIVRFVSPVMTFMRTVTEDHTYNGVDLQAGDRVFLLYQSANRDEEVFDDPDEFRIDRDPNPHLGFGIGTHYCLGANLARAEISVVFTELFSRLRDIRAVDPTAIDRGDSSLVLAMKHLPAVFTPESRA
ncbi:MAG TPA: cytochrome P450 [Acidimicrobiales bacterium]|nr:cytochrome P450 [Acidimicrobiales bacterium]